MKLFLFLWFNLALLCINKVSSKHLNEQEIVGVNSNKKIDDLLKKAISGFRNIMRTGNESLGIPILDPFKFDNLSWTYEDEDLGTKVDLTITAPATLKGLSNFVSSYQDIDIKNLYFQNVFKFENLELEVPYKIEGIIKNIFPVYGQGITKVNIGYAYFRSFADVLLKKSRITLKRLYANFGVSRIELDVPDLMDLPSSFSDHLLRDVLYSFLRYDYTTQFTEDFVKNLFQKYVAGKTIGEVMEFLNFYGNKAE